MNHLNLHFCDPFEILKARRGERDRGRIEAEREKVDRLINSSTAPRVYGFNTLLGHLDEIDSGPESQNNLLKAHLVGSQQNLPASWGRLLTACKLSQLSAGGSGIHSQTYDKLSGLNYSHWPEGIQLYGAWTSSYGSGDVVPGAWFVNALVAEFGFELKFPGDLICLINGNFVSTAVGLVAYYTAIRDLRESLIVLRSVRDFASERGIGEGAQLSVTMRDLNPIEASVEVSELNYREALIRRLTGPSCNPMFDFNEDAAMYVSQSSFLDFNLTGAISRTSESVQQMASYLKGCIRLRERSTSESDTSPVQPTKVAESRIALMESSFPASPVSFSISESEGIEDIGDMSLIAGMGLLRRATVLRDILNLAASEATLMGVGSETSSIPSCCATANDYWDLDDLASRLSVLT